MEAKALKAMESCGKIKTNLRWFACPACGKKLLRLESDTEARNLPVYCKSCHREIIVNISQSEPEPMSLRH